MVSLWCLPAHLVCWGNSSTRLQQRWRHLRRQPQPLMWHFGVTLVSSPAQDMIDALQGGQLDAGQPVACYDNRASCRDCNAMQSAAPQPAPA